MPRLLKEYSFKVDDPVATFGNHSTSFQSEDYLGSQPWEKTWLGSHPNNKYYNKAGVPETTNQNGKLFQNKEIQKFFYDSLKSFLSEIDIACSFNDKEQSLTMFGVKLYPSTYTIYPYANWYNNSSYWKQYKIYPIVFRDGDNGLQNNSFIGHPFNGNTNSYIVNYGTSYSGYIGHYWVDTGGDIELEFNKASSIINYNDNFDSSDLEEACNKINNARITFIAYYNTDYIIVNYRTHDETKQFPLFCLFKGTIQNIDKTSIVYCCSNPNDTVFYNNDYRNTLFALYYNSPTSYYFSIPYHTLVIPEYEDIPLQFNAEYTETKSPSEIRLSNARPFFIDWRRPNYQVSQLLKAVENAEDVTYIFRKQAVTGMNSMIQFSDNIIYADENCVNGNYYEINGSKYWCPTNSVLDYRYKYLFSADYQSNYRLYTKRILVKI